MKKANRIDWPDTDHCGSEPARDRARSGNIDVGWSTVIASRLAPTGIFSVWSIGVGHAPAPALVARELAPAGLRSGPWNGPARWVRLIGVNLVGAASQPSGSKLPRHGFVVAGAFANISSSKRACSTGRARSHRYFSVFGPLVSGHAPPPAFVARELAPSPRGLWWLGCLRMSVAAVSMLDPLAEHIPLWERACSRWGQVRHIDGGWSTAIASRLAPTGIFQCLVHWYQGMHLRRLLWRGSLLPLGCAAAPNHPARWVRLIEGDQVGAASQPCGSKLPRHTSSFSTRVSA